MMVCQNPNCGKVVPPGRRYCSERCSNVVRQRNFRARGAAAVTPVTVVPPESNALTPEPKNILSSTDTVVSKPFEEANRKNLPPASAYKGKGTSSLTPSWLDAEPVTHAWPTVAALIAEQIAQDAVKHDAVVTEVQTFLASWQDVADPISQVQLLRAFSGLPSVKERKEIQSYVESLGRSLRPLKLGDVGLELAKYLPDLECPHRLSWMIPCEDCDAGIRYEDVREWNVCEWRDVKGRVTGQSRGANAALSKLGMSKWAEVGKLEHPAGTGKSGDKLDSIDHAKQTADTLGGKRVKPKGLGPDSYDDRREDLSSGSQASSLHDPNYAGKKPGLGQAAGAAIPEEHEVNVDPRTLPAGYAGAEREYLPQEEREETTVLKEYNVKPKKGQQPLNDPVAREGPLPADAPIDSGENNEDGNNDDITT